MRWCRDRALWRPVSWPDAADDSGDRPAHALGSRVVRAVPGVPGPARPPPRRAPPAPRARPQLRPLPARRPDRGRRRLPRGTGRGGGDVAAPGRHRPPVGGAVDGPHGRVHGLGRDDRPRPPARPAARGRARRCDAGGIPARHVRPHRADAADPPAGRLRARGGVAGRPVDRHADGVHVGGARRLSGTRGVHVRVVLERSRPSRRRQAAGRAGAELRARARSGPASRRVDAADERHRPPDAATVARARRRGGERDPGRLPVRRDVARRIPPRPTHRGVRDGARRAAIGSACERAHGSGIEPRRCASGVCSRGARDRAPGGAAVGAARPGGSVSRRAPRDRVAEARGEQRPRLLVRMQRRRGRRPGDGALPRSAPDRRRRRARGDAAARHRG